MDSNAFSGARSNPTEKSSDQPHSSGAVIKPLSDRKLPTKRKFRLSLLGLPLLLAVGGCGTQEPSQTSTNLQPSVASLSNDSIVSRSGCTVDLAKVCQAQIDQPEIIYNNDKYDWVSFAQNFPPHTHIYLPLVLPNGHTGGTADCYIATERRKVLEAKLMPQPPLTDEAVEYVKSLGACEEQHPDYPKMIADFEKNADHAKPAAP